MQAKFAVTVDDYTAFNLHMYRKAGRGWGQVIGYASGLLVFGYLTLAYATNGQLCPAAWFGTLLLAFATVGPFAHRWLVEALIARNVRRYVRRLGGTGVVGPVTLTLTDEAVTWEDEASRTEVAWDKVVGVEETPDYLFIRVTALSAAIVPRRAFERPEEYAAIRVFAVDKVRTGAAGGEGPGR